MNRSTATATTVTLTVRLEPQLLRQVHQLADRREMTVSGAARHLLAIGIDQLQAAA
jgi:predicted transcriptional regulator